jgi:hypothetical protein
MQMKCHKNDLEILFAIVFAKLLQLLLKIIKNCTLTAGSVRMLPVHPLATPVGQPVVVRDRVEAELQKLVTENITALVIKPTPWVSALLVTTRRDNSLRIYIDPKFFELCPSLQHILYAVAD